MVQASWQYRIGQGVDIHRFATGRKLILGGITIPYELGLLGHSDADAVIHSTIDAILGATALGDIGQHFPDNSEKWKDINSEVMLKHILEMITAKGWHIENLDISVMLQRPKLLPYIPEMRQNMAKLLACELDRISIKATTAEGLGFIGEGLAIQVFAIAMLKRQLA